jgi:hypothetical protein
MNREAYGSLFSLFGGSNILFAVSMWVVTQGGLADLSLPGLDSHAKIASSYFSIILIGFLLFLTGLVGTGHARKSRSDAAKLAPIPAVGLGKDGEYTPGTVPGVIYEIVILFLFIVVPAASLIHLNRQVAGEGTLWNEELPAGAHLTAGCLLPGWWPFGNCDEASDPNAPAVLAAVRALRDVKDTGNPPVFEDGNNMSRLWLTNHWCDVYWAREMAGPQVKARNKCTDPSDPIGGLSENEARSFAALALLGPDDADKVRKFALARRGLPAACEPSYSSTCTGISNRSQACSDTGAGCRGIEWIRVLSPTLIILPTLLGWLGAALYFGSLGRGLLGGLSKIGLGGNG